MRSSTIVYDRPPTVVPVRKLQAGARLLVRPYWLSLSFKALFEAFFSSAATPRREVLHHRSLLRSSAVCAVHPASRMSLDLLGLAEG